MRGRWPSRRLIVIESPRSWAFVTSSRSRLRRCVHGGLTWRAKNSSTVSIDHANGATGETWIFERPLESADAGGAGERLTGATQFSDVPYGPCGAYEWLAGRRFECDDVTECRLCGDDESGSSSLPPCE